MRIVHNKPVLSRREMSVVMAVLKGYSYKQIASVMKISPRTVEWHMRNVYKKTKCKKRSDILQLLEDFDIPGVSEENNYRKYRFFSIVAMVLGGIILLLQVLIVWKICK